MKKYIDLELRSSNFEFHESLRTAGRQPAAHLAGDGGFIGFLARSRRWASTCSSSARAEFDAPVATSLALAIGGGQSWWSLRRGDRPCCDRPARCRSTSGSPAPRPTTSGSAIGSSRTSSRRWRSPPGFPSRRPTSSPTTIRTRSRRAAIRQHASIAVTDGLLETLNREELQGVVAHEMGHVRNLDIRLMTVVAALIGAIAAPRRTGPAAACASAAGAVTIEPQGQEQRRRSA